MSSPELERARVADHVRTVLAADGGIAVDVPDTPSGEGPGVRPRVVVQISGVENANAACSWRTVKLDLWIATGKTDPRPADVEVDAVLGRVLDALDVLPRGSWTTAERGVWQDTYPGYRVETETRT